MGIKSEFFFNYELLGLPLAKPPVWTKYDSELKSGLTIIAPLASILIEHKTHSSFIVNVLKVLKIQALLEHKPKLRA